MDYPDISQSQMENMKDQSESLCRFLEDTGRVTWTQMNEAGIPRSEKSIDRTDLAQVRHWSEIVNHPQTIERFRAQKYKASPEGRAAALLEQEHTAQIQALAKAEAEKIVLAQKIVDKEALALDRKRARDEIKSAFAALSEEQQEKERLKKIAVSEKNKENKKIKENAKTEEIRAAYAILGHRQLL